MTFPDRSSPDWPLHPDRAEFFVRDSSSSLSPQLQVVLVAPSLSILGGQAVQADRLLRLWDGDAEVAASLLPVNPDAPGPLRALQGIKYLRTVATQLVYWPTLVDRLRHADVVHV